MPDLFSPLTLRSGAVLPNRIAKAAMEEGIAGAEQAPDGRTVELYRRWGAGGTGLLITGNVMVHAEALTGPGAVVLDARSPLQPFRAWADAAKENGARIWMQISHPGRQIQKDMPGDPRPGVLPALALVRDLVVVRRALGRYRRWLADRPSDGAALTAAAVASGE